MLAPVTHLVDIMSKMTSKRLVDRLDRDGVMAHRFMTVDSVPPLCLVFLCCAGFVVGFVWCLLGGTLGHGLRSARLSASCFVSAARSLVLCCQYQEPFALSWAAPQNEFNQVPY